MSDWYYAEPNQQRRGPLPAENLRELFQSSRIGLDTLVWRDGLPNWRPLSEFAGELGLLDLTAAWIPPPLPPAAASPPPHIAHSARPASAPAKSGLSGCMIALIVAAVLFIPMAAILAAIALPAYQDYTLRAKVASAMPLAAPLKAAVAEHYDQHQTCPSNDDSGFGPAESYKSGLVAAATVGTFESDQCGIELMLTVPGNDALDGKAVWFEYDSADHSWQCSSEIDDKYLPVACRG
jgi:type IV pilus assembly protein PilA